MIQEKGQLPQASALRVPFVTFQRTRDTRLTTLFLQSRLLTTMLRRDELASRTIIGYPVVSVTTGVAQNRYRIIDIAFTLRARRAVPANGLGTEMFDPIQGD